MKNAISAHGGALSRRTLITAAVASLPAVPAFALPAVILPQRSLAAAMQEHSDAIAATMAPFAARRGADRWRFDVSDRGTGPEGSLHLATLSDELCSFGQRRYARMEVFGLHDREIWYSHFRPGHDDQHRASAEFSI